MTRCEHAQEQLLESLYGLLEPSEEQALRVHLEECASCRTVAAAAEEQRRLLARAAHVCVTVPAFTAPSESLVAGEPEPEILPVPVSAPLQAAAATSGRRRRLRVFASMAAAAAVLLAAAGLWSRHVSEVTERETELADARGRLRELDQRITQAQEDYQRAQAKLPTQAERGLLRLEVAGPGTMTTGAATPIRVSTRDAAGRPQAARLTIRQVANGKEVHRQEVASAGDRTVTLPAGQMATGDAKLFVEARADDAVARIEETIKLEAPAHMAHLAVSKSICQVGEVLFFRALVLRGFDMRLPEKPVPVQFALRNQQGKAVKQLAAKTGPGGIAAGELPLTHDLISGTYTLEVKADEAAAGMRPARRHVEIVRDLPPQLQFDRQEYRAGDTLTAQFKGRRLLSGQAVPNEDINVRITVDGKDVKVEQAEQKLAAPSSVPGNTAPGGVVPGGAAALLRTDAAGNAAFRATLPKKIETGKALVEIQSRAGKQRDKLVQNIPVVASRLSVDFFPEGGQLVAGVPNRVYYRVRTPLGEPADPEGYVIILSSKDVVLASERNQGLGAFTFTPDTNDAYTLRVTSSHGVVETANPFAKLGIRDKGVALHVPEAVSAEGKPLRIVVRNTGATRRLLAVASCRGRIVAQEFVDASQGSHEVRLDPIAGARGVVRVTVYDAGGAALMPLAERLVYRAPAVKLAIAAPLDKKPTRPGARTTIPLTATNEKGEKVATWYLASVVNERTLGVFDQSAAGPAATFYLLSATPQAQDLEDADVLVLDSERARQDLDLFLGSQGWRRFVAVEPVEAAQLANRGAADTSMTLFCRESASPAQLQARRTEALQAELAQLRRDHIRAVAALDGERGSAVARVTLAARELAALQGRPVEMLRLSMGVLVLILIAAGIIALCLGLVRGLRRSASSTSAFASAFGCLLACLVIYAASGSLPDQPRVEPSAGLAALPRNRLIPDPLQLPEGPAATGQAGGMARGLFALSPSTGDAAARPESRGNMERTVRAVKDTYAEAERDHNGYGAPTATVSNHMKQRFLELEYAKATEPVYSATDPTVFAKNAKGTKSKGDKSGESKHVAANMAREYRYWGNGAAVEATLLWQPALFAADGTASISLDLPQAPASYRILILGHDASGRVGQLRETLQAR